MRFYYLVTGLEIGFEVEFGGGEFFATFVDDDRTMSLVGVVGRVGVGKGTIDHFYILKPVHKYFKNQSNFHKFTSIISNTKLISRLEVL